MTDKFDGLAAGDLTAFPCLSKGIDSNVYRVGDWVAKEYQKLSTSELDSYVALQNEASRYLRENPYRTTILLEGVLTELVADSAIPVEWVGRSVGGKPLTFSRFVEATNLEKLLWRPEMFEAYADAQLSDPSARDFAARLNAYFWNEYPTRAQDELHYHVCMLSRRLGEALGCGGLYISKYNVKLQPAAQASRIHLIITDLALYIERVALAATPLERRMSHAG